jgi:hypothetical protein
MGAIIGKSMDENLRKNQEFMVATQRAQLERQMHMQNAMREQQMAIQLARGRDMFHYWIAFYTVAGTAAVAAFKKSRNPSILVPFLPLGFIVAYFGDMAYGTKMERIRAEAERILLNESHLIDLPQPLPSLEDLDRRREAYRRSLD